MCKGIPDWLRDQFQAPQQHLQDLHVQRCGRLSRRVFGFSALVLCTFSCSLVWLRKWKDMFRPAARHARLLEDLCKEALTVASISHKGWPHHWARISFFRDT